MWLPQDEPTHGKAHLHHPYNPYQCGPMPEGPGAWCHLHWQALRKAQLVAQMDIGRRRTRPPTPSLSRVDDPFQDPLGEKHHLLG